MRTISAAFFALVLTPTIALAESVGTSCADCPNYAGAYSIENTTGVTIGYQFRWGDKNPWKSISLASGRVETHRYPLGDNRNARVPTPYIRFDRVAGDANYTAKEYRMEFYAIGYPGYGPKDNKTEPKRYVFRYSANGKSLDVKAK
jgi:hypothetical protein